MVRTATLNYARFATFGDLSGYSLPDGTVAIFKFPDVAQGARPSSLIVNLTNDAPFAIRVYVHRGTDIATLGDEAQRADFELLGNVTADPEEGSDTYLVVQPGGVARFSINPVQHVSGSLITHAAIILENNAGTTANGFKGRLDVVHFEGTYQLVYP